MTPPKPSPQGEFEREPWRIIAEMQDMADWIERTKPQGLLYDSCLPVLREAVRYAALGQAAEANGLASYDDAGEMRFQPPIDHLLSQNERLKGEVERVSDLAHRLAKLFHAAAQASWDGYDLDGGTIQSLGEELRLLEREPYDPDEHGESVNADPGDEIFTLVDDVRAALNPPGGQG